MVDAELRPSRLVLYSHQLGQLAGFHTGFFAGGGGGGGSPGISPPKRKSPPPKFL